jgi:hypothetical protein
VAGALGKVAAEHADAPAKAAEGYLRKRASDAGHTLRTSDSAPARSLAAKDLPRFGRAAQTAGKVARVASVAGSAASAASDYQGQRTAGHSPADSAGYATARQAGGKTGAIAATLLCAPGDVASFGLAEVGCLAAGNELGNLAGGWVYGLARAVHGSGSGAKETPPRPGAQVFILPL